MRVAWVDDVEVIRLVAQRIIERAGGTCAGFADHAALLASGAFPFDAAILQPTDAIPADVVRAELRRRGVGIVLLASGVEAATWRQAGIDVDGFDGFLQKPFSFGDLREALELDGERDGVAS